MISTSRMIMLITLLVLTFSNDLPTVMAEEGKIDSPFEFMVVNSDPNNQTMREVTYEISFSFNVSFEIVEVDKGSFDSGTKVNDTAIRFTVQEISYESNKAGYCVVILETSGDVKLELIEEVVTKKTYDPVSGIETVVNLCVVHEEDPIYDPFLNALSREIHAAIPIPWEFVFRTVDCPMFSLDVQAVDPVMEDADWIATYKIIVTNQHPSRAMTIKKLIVVGLDPQFTWKISPPAPFDVGPGKIVTCELEIKGQYCIKEGTYGFEVKASAHLTFPTFAWRTRNDFDSVFVMSAHLIPEFPLGSLVPLALSLVALSAWTFSRKRFVKTSFPGR